MRYSCPSNPFVLSWCLEIKYEMLRMAASFLRRCLEINWYVSNIGSTSFLSRATTNVSEHLMTGQSYRTKIIIHCGTGLFRHQCYDWLLPQSWDNVSFLLSKEAGSLSGPVHLLVHTTYPTEKMLITRWIHFQPAGGISVWQRLQHMSHFWKRFWKSNFK